MKKIFLFAVLVFGLLPYYHNGSFKFSNATILQAQNQESEAADIQECSESKAEDETDANDAHNSDMALCVAQHQIDCSDCDADFLTSTAEAADQLLQGNIFTASLIEVRAASAYFSCNINASSALDACTDTEDEDYQKVKDEIQEEYDKCVEDAKAKSNQ